MTDNEKSRSDFYLILPSNDNRHFFIGSTTSMHRPPAEYAIALSSVNEVSGKDDSSRRPTSGIYHSYIKQQTI